MPYLEVWKDTRDEKAYIQALFEKRILSFKNSKRNKSQASGLKTQKAKFQEKFIF